MMAPIATAFASGSPSITATIGISVSGIAVPTAASRLPTAPCPNASRWPAHSTALVNSNAPARMIAKLANRRTAVPIRGALSEAEGQAEDQIHGQ